GQALTFAKVSGPTYATVTTTTPGTGTATGNVALAPGFSDSGTATVSVSASDGAASDGKSFTVTVINQNRAPTLNQPADQSVAQGFTSDQTIIGSDPDGDALTFAKVSGPTYMTVTTTNATTGNIHLAAGISEPLGSSSASVSASDGSLSNTKSLTVTVTPTNHAPVLAQPANMTVNEGVTADQTLNATDADANPLTFSKSAGPTYATVTTTTPGTGTATGNLHLAPGFSDSGTASVSVLVSDGSLTDSKSLTVTVNNVNRPPTLTQPANMTVNEGATADQTLLANDPDGDALTFAKVSGPTFETVVGSNVHLAPGFSDSGTYSSTVSVSDASASDSKSFPITVNNVDRAPVMAAIANQTVQEGTTADVAVSATDADGDVITLSASLPSFATLSSVPAAGTVNGTVHIAPAIGDAAGSPYPASVTASSGSPVLTNTKNFTITVSPAANRAPTLVQPADMTVNEGMTADQTLTASDPDGNPLTFSKVTGPLFLTVTTTTSTTGNAHLAPGFSDAGVSTAVVRATDTGSLFDQKSFSITVNNVNRAPVANAGGPYSGTVGVPVSFNGTGSSDPDGDALTYAWDFGDAGTGTGSSPTHTYAATGTYTVNLTVTDNGTPALSNSASTTTTITNELAAFVFKSQVGIIKLKGGKPYYCYEVQPVGGDYSNTDVILTTITMTFGGKTVSAEASRTSVDSDKNLDGIQEIKTCFSKANLQILFAGLPTGLDPVTLTIQGNLTTGGKFSGTVQDTVKVTGNGSALEASVSPNPLNPQTTLHFTTSKPGTVRIEMFDLQGRLVRTIQSTTYMMTGDHELTIDGRGQSGEKLASGVYFIRGETADGTFKNAITILK
ncbi:MAG TPA: Ig-like domain-containing protein, partial [Candidatus Binatia bacterium]|nr:Ig-like domain-containing protein [Candidatus Binatia bacterium]